MAAILNLILKEEVSADTLVKWLQSEVIDALSLSKLDVYKNIRLEFIPYFLNHVRENTAHLFENGLSSGQSPVKKLSAKKPKPALRSVNPSARPKRSRLFSKDQSEKEKNAPSEIKVKDFDERKQCIHVQHLACVENSSGAEARQSDLKSVLCPRVADIVDPHQCASDILKTKDFKDNILNENLIQGLSESLHDEETSNSFERSRDLSLNSFAVSDSRSPEVNIINTVSPVTRNRKKKSQIQDGQASQHISPQFHSAPHRYNRTGHKQNLSLGEFFSSPDSSSYRNAETQRTLTFTDSSPEASWSSTRKNGRNTSSKKNRGLITDKQAQNFSQTRLNDFSVNSLQDFPPLNVSSPDPISDISSANTLNIKTPSSANSKSPLFSSSVGSVVKIQQDCEPQVTQTWSLLNAVKKQNHHSKNLRYTNLKQPRRISPITISSVSTNSANPLFSEAPIEEHEIVEPKLHVSTKSASRLQTNKENQNGSDAMVPIGIMDQQPGHLRSDSSEKQRADVLSKEEEILDSPRTPSKQASGKSVSIIQLIQANPQKVTYRDFLDLFVYTYSACLEAHLFPNLTAELFFITQLLTVQGCKEMQDEQNFAEDVEDKNYFLTIHNAVYFATGVMRHHVQLLSKLDQTTLRLLSDNPRVADFAPDLQDQLKSFLESALEKTSTSMSFTTIPGVAFQAETDNRKNFPNDRTFHLFKKQRDLFYEVLREWEAQQSVPGWSLESHLGNKIRGLVGAKTELANYLHLTRLFLSQLISMCKGDQNLKAQEDSETISLLVELKETNPEKYIKLQERISQPSASGGQCSVTFPGHQRFFRDFIVVAANPVLNHHLSSLLSIRITELNRTEFGEEVLSSQADLVPDDMEMECKTFASTLLTLRLLARFLGFITFLPYQSPDGLPQPLLQDCITVRSVVPMPLDLGWYVQAALKSGRLSLVVPWVVEFLGQMDTGAYLLESFQHLFHLLQSILRLVWQQMKANGFSYSGLLIVTSIGWLSDLACLPGLPSNTEMDLFVPSVDCGSVDAICMVTQDLFYSCCPYLGEIRYLLSEFSIGTRSKTTIRKITLSAVDAVPPSAERETSKNLQASLEESFFHLHPSSLRRTVEFVADRTASNFIKQMRASFLPESLANCREEARNLAFSLSTKSNGNPKENVQQELNCLAQSICLRQRDKIMELQKSFCQPRISTSLQLLLSEDESKVVISCATAIACRTARMKILHWLKTYVTVAMYSREVMDEWVHYKTSSHSSAIQTRKKGEEPGDKICAVGRLPLDVSCQGNNLSLCDLPEKPKNKNSVKNIKDIVYETILLSKSDEIKPTESGSADTEMTTSHPVKMMCDLLRDGQDLLCRLLIRAEPVNSKDIVTHLHSIQASLTVSKDLPPQTAQCLASMTADVALEVICKQPSQWSQSICTQFIRLFEGVLWNQTDLSRLCSGLAKAKLMRAADKKMAVEQFRMLLNMLVEHKLLQPEAASCFTSQLS